MVIIALLFGLIDLTPTTNALCATDDTGLNICHDGGCNYVNPSFEKCECNLSKGVLSGKYCGVYDQQCFGKTPCGIRGTCHSGIGHQVCTCDESYFGYKCNIPKPYGKSNNYSFCGTKLSNKYNY